MQALAIFGWMEKDAPQIAAREHFLMQGAPFPSNLAFVFGESDGKAAEEQMSPCRMRFVLAPWKRRPIYFLRI
jgi:hypothetical protein